jgi:UrcA family protein
MRETLAKNGEDTMNRSRFPIRVTLLGAALAAAMPLWAQAAPEEITVTGRYGRVPDNVQSLSQAISYADLDLSTTSGKDELRHRVSLTARFLCDKLGESASSTGPAASCRDAATRDAMTRAGTVEAGFAPRGTTWAHPAAWHAPYPADWVKTYP